MKHQIDNTNHNSFGDVKSIQKLNTQSKLILNEIGRESLLFKSLYTIVAFFCVGTELRFLAIISPQRYSLKDSEIWHAKAI